MGVREPDARYLPSALQETEVGPVPFDWSIVRLEEIADPERPISYGIVQTGPRVQNGVPCLRVVDIQDGKVQLDDLITTSKEISNAYRRTKLREGDLVVPLRGKVGECAQIEKSLADANLTRGVALVSVLPKYSASFCKQFFSSSRSRARLSGSMNGSALQEVPIASLRSFKIALPPTQDEQNAIAKALNDTDALIDSLEQLLTKKRQIKQGAMQELLTGKRRIRQSADWHDLRLGDVASLKARIGWQGLTTAEYRERGDHLPVTGTEFYGGRIRWDACHFVDQDRYDQDKNIQLAPGDVLVTKDGTIGKAALIDTLPMPATLNSGVFVIRPRNQAFHPGFFYYLLASTVFSSFLGQLSAGSTINHLYQKDFVHFKFRAPQDIEEQRAVFEVLKAIDSEIETIDSRLTKARSLKQAMAQSLLTGRIRLVPPIA